eukprot:Rhum_TRINITY_DN14797_c8_g1::Rhum_TRINITY_DN14797_c8_g1_i1::g.117170::m.117170
MRGRGTARGSDRDDVASSDDVCGDGFNSGLDAGAAGVGDERGVVAAAERGGTARPAGMVPSNTTRAPSGSVHAAHSSAASTKRKREWASCHTARHVCRSSASFAPAAPVLPSPSTPLDSVSATTPAEGCGGCAAATTRARSEPASVASSDPCEAADAATPTPPSLALAHSSSASTTTSTSASAAAVAATATHASSPPPAASTSASSLPPSSSAATDTTNSSGVGVAVEVGDAVRSPHASASDTSIAPSSAHDAGAAAAASTAAAAAPSAANAAASASSEGAAAASSAAASASAAWRRRCLRLPPTLCVTFADAARGLLRRSFEAAVWRCCDGRVATPAGAASSRRGGGTGVGVASTAAAAAASVSTAAAAAAAAASSNGFPDDEGSRRVASVSGGSDVRPGGGGDGNGDGDGDG